MKKLKSHSALHILFAATLIMAFGGGRFAAAQDGNALEIDEITTSCQFELITPVGVELVHVSGSLTQHVHFEGPDKGNANDDDTDGLDEVSTEIVAMDLRGTSPSLGEVRLHVHSNIPSLGQIKEQVNSTPGVLDVPPFTPAGMADSFFDVFFRIELPGLGQSFFAAQPKRLFGVITHKPQAPCDSYENNDQTPIIDANGNLTSYFMGTMRLEIACEDDCDWEPGDAYKMHWPQLPDLSSAGMDVDMSLLFLADDFECTASEPINDIHIWASFRDDVLPEDGPDSLTFEISIYSDIPATGGGWSMPGDALWSRTFKPGEYSVRKLDDSPEGWYDPAKELYLPDNHTQAYQYNFCIKEEPYIQEEGTIYWLGVKELAPAGANYKFGWKTTTHKLGWNDDAVFFLAEKTVSFPLKYPIEHDEYMGESLNLAFVVTGSGESRAEHDLGDAPDSSNSFPGATMLAYPSGVVANYPTVYEAGSPPHGPIHWQPNAMYHLGRAVTGESEADIGYDEDIKNNLIPSDDLSDLDGGDDGIPLTLVLPHCQEATFDYTVTVSAPDLSMAIVNVWFDWNRDGDWDDVMECPDGTTVPEWAVQNHMLLFMGPGPLTLTTPKFICWHPQTEEQLDPIWMRITIAELPWGQDIAGAAISGGSAPADGYEYGETEDYLIYPRKEGEPLEYDWGDAPDSAAAAGYPTLSTNSGANHVIAGPWLGDDDDRPDWELNGQPEPSALGDNLDIEPLISGPPNDDENGVIIPTLIPGQPANITIEVNGGGGIVQGWIDFNSDMTWQAFEQVYDGFLADGTHTISLSVPDSTVVGQTFARFRISKQGGLGPEGPAPDGEVEDHEVIVESAPQVTSRPGSATQCPVVETQCPTVATRCPPVDTRCPAVATQCPAVQTQCVAVTMCPPVNTTCPALSTQCPAIETQCPVAETKCPVEQTKCPPVQTRCPAVDTECPPLLTRCPPKETECSLVPTACQGVRTQCPPVDTQCPAVDTECPSELTKCPPAPTQCPAVITECRAIETECPAVTTQCPLVPTQCPITLTHMTQCPVVETRCPPAETRCPVVDTECPPLETRCPGQDTKCPVAETRCPPEVSKCPPAPTQCTAVDTECPPTKTQCPAVDTQCPPVETRCPPVVSKCPPVPTQCTAVDTQCPSVDTRCPPVETECPPAQTKCPPTVTECQQVRTQCPATLTECRQVETECPATVTECRQVETECPADETRCPPVNTRCPVEKTRCPESETNCPPVQTKCPAVDTRCPPVETQCPAEDTRCPPEKTRCPPALTTCPICVVETILPVKTRCPTSQTNCPAIDTQCPPVETQCPPVETECPPVETQCPLSLTSCLSLYTFCPICWPLPFSQNPVVETKDSPVTAECPAIDVQAPTVITKPIAKAF